MAPQDRQRKWGRAPRRNRSTSRQTLARGSVGGELEGDRAGGRYWCARCAAPPPKRYHSGRSAGRFYDECDGPEQRNAGGGAHADGGEDAQDRTGPHAVQGGDTEADDRRAVPLAAQAPASRAELATASALTMPKASASATASAALKAGPTVAGEPGRSGGQRRCVSVAPLRLRKTWAAVGAIRVKEPQVRRGPPV